MLDGFRVLFCSVLGISYIAICTEALLESSERNDLQARYSRLFDRLEGQSFVGESLVSSAVESELLKVVSVVSNEGMFLDMEPPHMEALHRVKTLFRAQKNSESLLRLAEEVRDFPGMNYRLWLKAFGSVAYERDDFAGLRRPHPLALTPELFLTQDAYKAALTQASLPPTARACIPVDGSLTADDNGVEHALWYFREDLLLGFQHGFWHNVHPILDETATYYRRGEGFYFYHRNFVARYNAERLANGLGRVKALVVEDGWVIEEGYFPHLAEMNSFFELGSRHHDTPIQNMSDIAECIKNMADDLASGYLLAANGTEVNVLSVEGIDLIGNNLEASPLLLINPERYMDFGCHNWGHAKLSYLSENGTGVMAVPTAAMKDPVFYRWHQTVDDLFQVHKIMLHPYDPNSGEFQLVWEDVEVSEVVVRSEMDGSPSNMLYTFFGSQSVEIPLTPDGLPPVDNGTLEYCIKRLEYTPFEYTITAVRNESAAPVNGTVRIFMAPRQNEPEGRFSLEQQRLLFFPLDQFQVVLNPGETVIRRKSADSTLTAPWRLEDSVEPPSDTRPSCGCGWPQHLLLPRGTPQGMAFDLFVMITDAAIDNVPGEGEESEDVCSSARILCGVRGEKFPDSRPMGYPFDRRPFSVPNEGAVDSIDEFVLHVPNSKSTQVVIVHVE